MTEPDVDLSDRGLTRKRIVVTGASRGLGRAMAVALAATGATVHVTGRDQEALGATLDEIAVVGGTGIGHALDVTDHAGQEALAAQIWSDGPVDAVIANAGISSIGPSRDLDVSELARIFDTNVSGTFSTLRAFGPRMLDRGKGKLITVSSDIGLRGSAGWLAYGASKAAIVNMTKTLAWEWAPAVTVNSIAPGAFATDINSHLLSVPEIMAGITETTPLGRVGRTSEIGPLAVFLCGSGSDFMTGQVLSIDGGIQRS